MFPDRRQHGFSLITAVFLLVVLAGLAGFIASISSQQHVAMAMDIQGARAYQAARVGLEWGAYQVLRVDTADLDAASFGYRCRRAGYAAAGGTPVSADLAGLAGDLAGFAVTVKCATAATANWQSTTSPASCPGIAKAQYCDGGTAVWVYEIEATACNPAGGGTSCPNAGAVGSLSYVERRVTVTVSSN